MLRSKSSRYGNADFGQKNHPSVLSRTLSASKFCRGDALASQIDSSALKSFGRKSVDRYPSKVANSSENRINRIAIMQEQLGKPNDEVNRTKDRLEAADQDEKARAFSELREAKRLVYEADMKVSEALSPWKTGELMTEVKNLKELLANSVKELKMKDEKIECLKLELQEAKQFEVKLAERDASFVGLKVEFDKVKASEAYALELLSGSNKRIVELEDEVHRGNVSEAKMLDSLASQTKQLEQIKIELEESKLEIAALNERIASSQLSSKENDGKHNQPDRKEENDILIGTNEILSPGEKEKIALSKSKSSVNEMDSLRSELKLAIEAEEKSKKAMDDLALVLKEVATESNQTKEKLGVAQLQLEQVKGEAEQLKMIVRSTEERYEKLLDGVKKEAELHRNTADRLRVEAEETLLAWNGKEMGFVSCIKIAEEERAVAQYENGRLSESLKSAEHKMRAARDESYKLRDILKQAINESNAAKAAASLARDENSCLKDILVEKDEALYFLTQENERLRITEVAAEENVKELKQLLSIATRDQKPPNKNEDVILRSQSFSLGDNDEDEKKHVRKNFSFDLKELKYSNDGEDSDQTIISHEDPEKAEALKGSIFDSSTDTPRSETTTMQSPRSVVHHRKESSSVFTDDGDTPMSEDHDHLDNGNFDESDSDRNHRRRKTMFRRVGDLIMRRSFSQRGSIN